MNKIKLVGIAVSLALIVSQGLYAVSPVTFVSAAEGDTKQPIISGTEDIPSQGGSTEYANLMGNGDVVWGLETTVTGIITAPGALTNFMVAVAVAPGAGKSWTFTIRKGSSGGSMAATALSVSIADTATVSSLDSDSVAVVAGDKVSISAVGVSTPTAAGAVYWQCEFIPTTPGETILLSTGLSMGANTFYTLVSPKVTNATEFDGQTLFPMSGTLKNLYAELTATPGAGNTRTFTIHVNGGAASALTLTISNPDVTGNNTADTVTIAAGDKVTIKATVSGTPTAANGYFGVTFVPDTPGQWFTSATTNDPTSSTAVEYQHLNCGDSTLTGTESEQHGLAVATTAQAIFVNLATAPGAANTWIFTLREALADTTVTVNVADTTTSNNATGFSEIIADAALVNLSIDARPGTATSKSQIAVLFYNAPEAGGAPFIPIIIFSKSLDDDYRELVAARRHEV